MDDGRRDVLPVPDPPGDLARAVRTPRHHLRDRRDQRDAGPAGAGRRSGDPQHRPTTPERVARRLPDAEGALYAAPSLLDRLGPLSSPADLARADVLSFDTGEAMAGVLHGVGIPTPPERLRFASASHLTLWAYCRAGLGLAVNMTVIGDAAPAVRRVPVDLPPLPVAMWLVSHRALRTSRRLRVVADALVAERGGTEPGQALT